MESTIGSPLYGTFEPHKINPNQVLQFIYVPYLAFNSWNYVFLQNLFLHTHWEYLLVVGNANVSEYSFYRNFTWSRKCYLYISLNHQREDT